MFLSEVPHYQQAMAEAGFKENLKYKEVETLPREESGMEGREKRRSRNIIWFTPPYSQNIKTNVGKRFITILRKHFPPSSPLYTLFNTKKVKLSYSTCPSMQSVISAHNSKVTRPREEDVEPGCNCRGGSVSCPLQGKCQTKSLVYKATVSSQEGLRSYLGQASSTFKLRYNNHKNSFINPTKEHSTALSTYSWNLSRRGVDHTVAWSTVSLAKPYRRGEKVCQLCLMEKVLIVRSDRAESLNKRTEVMMKCRHILPHLLSNYHNTHHLSPSLPHAVPTQQLPDPDDQPPGVQPEEHHLLPLTADNPPPPQQLPGPDDQLPGVQPDEDHPLLTATDNAPPPPPVVQPKEQDPNLPGYGVSEEEHQHLPAQPPGGQRQQDLQQPQHLNVGPVTRSKAKKLKPKT
jgi:hypothetical protein